MKKLTIMIVSSDSRQTRQFSISSLIMKGAMAASCLGALFAGYLSFDYVELRALRHSYSEVVAENGNLKGEAKALMTNLESVKTSLRKVQDYSTKLGELTHLNVEKLSHKTGIGPLSKEEDNARSQSDAPVVKTNKIPLGVNLDQLTFRPIFKQLEFVGENAEESAMQLQTLLSTLTEQKSLLSSIPAVSPVVSGWITSKFGSRVSPFTGDLSQHKGLDVAAPIGTPIYAPADGVVVFVGAKEGYGNFVMVAHGYGVVSGYGHNTQNLVIPGQVLKRGDQIATVGQTGRTTGPHLHYEIWVNGRVANPEKFIVNMDEISL